MKALSILVAVSISALSFFSAKPQDASEDAGKSDLVKSGTEDAGKSDLVKIGTEEKYEALLKEILERGSNLDDGIFYETNDSGVSSEKAVAAPRAVARGESMASADSSAGYSETNIQTSGVGEADIIKTDGKNIYYVKYDGVYIVDASDPSNLKTAKKITYLDADGESQTFNPSEAYVTPNRLVVIGNSYNRGLAVPGEAVADDLVKIAPSISYYGITKVYIYDINTLEELKTFSIEANYNSSRMIGDVLYMVTNNYIYDVQPLPIYFDGEKERALDLNRTYYIPDSAQSNFTNVASIDTLNIRKDSVVESYLGNSGNIYCSEQNLYIAASFYSSNLEKTTIYKFGVKNGVLTAAGKGSVEGYVLNQFSMDEYDGAFRIATTTMGKNFDSAGSSCNVFILDENLNVSGKLTGLAKGEEIKSARFMGDKGYLVTFEQIDPLFVVDLSDKTAPKVLGELKIPGYSSYLHPYDENTLIGFGVEVADENGILKSDGLKLAIFDVSDVASPKLLFAEKIGDAGSYSSLLYDHKALTYDASRGIFAFPATSVIERIENVNGNEYYGSFSWQGAFVYKVDLQNGFTLLGQITHRENKNDYDDVQRVIYIGDVLYTVSHNKIKSTDMNGFKELDAIAVK
jgi:uncharacterized secreted protein with C-terminal beta-propeller domain